MQAFLRVFLPRLKPRASNALLGDSLTVWQLHEIEKMQSMISTIVKGLIAKGVDYHDIYQHTKSTIESYSALAFFNQPLIA